MPNANVEDLYHLMFTDYPDIVSVEQLEDMLGISQRTAYRLLAAGTIPALKVGWLYRIPKINVIRYALSVMDAPMNA